ncbi:MAG: NUDIX hydrolase [Ignisphaera sp.]
MEIFEFIEEHTLCRGKRIELVQRIYRLGNDFIVKDVVKFGQSVAIVPVKNGKTIVLIKQFRAPVGRWIVEVPAGRIEYGETPEEAVVRELKEEIGYEPKYVKKLVSVYLSPGYSDEVIHVYLAKNLEYVGSSPEKGELIEVFEAELDKALELVLLSDIVDAKTLIALLIARKYV